MNYRSNHSRRTIPFQESIDFTIDEEMSGDQLAVQKAIKEPR